MVMVTTTMSLRLEGSRRRAFVGGVKFAARESHQRAHEDPCRCGILREAQTDGPDRCTSDERPVATMADVTAIQRSPLASFLRARLNEEAQAAHEAITHSSTAHFTVSAEVAAHIGRWDPARVLADVQARRR